jgi:enoyl-CoA hydratase
MQHYGPYNIDTDMSDTKVLYQRDGRIVRITLNRPEALNAIDSEIPALLEDAVERANHDPLARVMVLSGNGKAFCAGYDLKTYAESPGTNPGIQDMPWDPMKDLSFMKRNTDHFMSLWRSLLPVICKIQGYAIAGGSDLALCSDLLLIAEDARIGYPTARVWGTPTTAMWVYRLGAERAKRLLLTGDLIDGCQAAEWGLGEAHPAAELDSATEALATRISRVPRNQLIMQKLMVNQALENMGLASTQTLATLFDGISRHSPEGVHFKQRAETVGWKQAVRERDDGSFDWSQNEFFNDSPEDS